MRFVVSIILILSVVFFDPKGDVLSSFQKNFKKSYYFDACKIDDSPSPDFFHVVEVIDGDTIQISDKCRPVTVRLLGVDTPETVDPRKPVQCFGPEASNYSKNILSDKDIIIETEPDREKYDIYGRLLGYVILADGTNFNKSLIENGFAREYTYGSTYHYRNDFLIAQENAKQAGRGFWASSACD